MTTPHDDSFFFDLSPQSTALTIDQLCAQLATSYDELLLSFQLMVTYLTAYSTTCVDSVPNPADPLRSVMNNPFVLVQAPVTSTTVLAQESNATRRVKVTDTFQLDYQRSYGSYVQARDALNRLITQLYQSFPLTPPSELTAQQQSSGGTTTEPMCLSDVNIHNIESLSRINILTLITQNISLRVEQDFPNEEAYIDYLRETKRVLYHRVKKQLDVIEHLKQQAVSLQSTLTLYRARWLMILILTRAQDLWNSMKPLQRKPENTRSQDDFFRCLLRVFFSYNHSLRHQNDNCKTELSPQCLIFVQNHGDLLNWECNFNFWIKNKQSTATHINNTTHPSRVNTSTKMNTESPTHLYIFVFYTNRVLEAKEELLVDGYPFCFIFLQIETTTSTTTCPYGRLKRIHGKHM